MTHPLVWFTLLHRTRWSSVFVRVIDQTQGEYVTLNGRAKRIRPVQLKLEGIGL